MRNHKSRWKARRTWREYVNTWERCNTLKITKEYATNDMVVLLQFGHQPSRYVRNLAAL